MTRLLMLVEGQSEEIFVKKTLAPFLAESGIYATPTVLWTKRHKSGGGFHGGVTSYSKIKRDLMPLTGDSNAKVTTLLDFYGLPADFPGYTEARASANPRSAVLELQGRFASEINRPNFIPFLALHELEAWVFSDPRVVADHFGNAPLAEKLAKVVTETGNPELINHGEKTHPKARRHLPKTANKEPADGAGCRARSGIPPFGRPAPILTTGLPVYWRWGIRHADGR